MKILLLAMLLLSPSLLYAQVKINALPAASSVAGSDLTIADQSGTTRTATFVQVATYVFANTPALSLNLANTTAPLQYLGSTVAAFPADSTGNLSYCIGLSACAGANFVTALKSYVTAIGYQTCGGAGAGLSFASNNIEHTCIGTYAGSKLGASTQYDTVVGVGSLRQDATATNTTILGVDNLEQSTGASGTIAIGVGTLRNGNPTNVVAIGNAAIQGKNDFTSAPSHIVAVGSSALNSLSLVSPANVTAIGDSVGQTCASGSGNILVGKDNLTDCFSASSASELNIGGILFQNLTSLAAPAVSACGTAPSIDANANNHSGTVTIGSVATSCTITFAGGGYAQWSHCRVTSQSSVSGIAYSYTKTAITVAASVLGGDLVDYDCDGY